MSQSGASLAFNFLKGRDTASPHMRRVADNAEDMSRRIRLASVVSAGATLAVGAAYASLAAQGVALVSATAPVIGLIAEVPAVAFAAAGGVAALVVGLSGLGAAFKRTAGGAGQSAQAIAAAEHRIELAQRSATQAQLDLNDARKTAAERLADIARESARAHLDEEGAVLAVADAQRALREARRSGDRVARQHADLGYREAVQSLAEVRARLADVTAEEERRRAAGVEGSDEVQTALQRQSDAVYELAQAQQAMNQSSGGVDKAAEAYAKLTTEGRALVDVVRQIGPAWRGVQQATQSALLGGVTDDIGALSTVYLPVMRAQLPAIAQGWNNAARGTAQMAASADFVDDMNGALAKTATFWQRIGASFAPFLSGFRHFAVVGSDFLPRVGSWVQRIGERFNQWAEAARRTGRAHDWIEKAATTFGQIWQIAKNLGASIVAIFRAGSGGPDWMPGLVAGTEQLRAWLESPAGQGKLAEVFETLRDIGSKLWAVVETLGPALLNLFTSDGFNTALGEASNILGFMSDHVDELVDALPYLTAAWLALKVAERAEVFWGFAALIVKGASVAVMVKHTRALKDNTLALGESTAATTAAAGAGTAASAAAGVSIGAVIGIIGLFIIAIGIQVATIWWFVAHSEKAWHDFKIVWEAWWTYVGWKIQDTVAGIVGVWRAFMDWLRSIHIDVPYLWTGLVESFRWSLNQIIGWWNRLEFRLPAFSFGGLSIGGGAVGTPDIPYLDTGGRITRTGLAVVHEGEEVATAAEVQRGGRGGGQQVTISFAATGDPLLDAIVKELRKFIRVDSGGDVQVSLGR